MKIIKVDFKQEYKDDKAYYVECEGSLKGYPFNFKSWKSEYYYEISLAEAEAAQAKDKYFQVFTDGKKLYGRN